MTKHPLLVALAAVLTASLIGYFGWLTVAVVGLQSAVRPIEKIEDNVGTLVIDVASLRMVIKAKHPEMDLSNLWHKTNLGSAPPEALARFLLEVRQSGAVSDEARSIADSAGFKIGPEEKAILVAIGYLPPN